jgi:hypothetical protein
MKYAAMILLLLTSTAYAMDEKIFINRPPPLPVPNPITEEEAARVQPSEENKKWFLERGYKLNYDRMCCGFVDAPSGADDVRPIKTERIIPVTKAEDKNEIDEAADLQQKWVRLRGDRTLPNNVCEEHHMHKVTTSDGRSWRCRK